MRSRVDARTTTRRPGITSPAIDGGTTAPLVVEPDVITPGRARVAPLRREGPEKLVGEALYADDLVFEGGWYGGTVRSEVPHGRFEGLDLDPGFAWDGVIVATADDIPGVNVVSLIHDDQPILVPLGGEIRHRAEPLALIAAPDRATLHEALSRAGTQVEALPPVLDPEASDQVFASYDLARGDLETGFAEADLVLEGTYRTGHQEQLYIEPMAMIAVPEPDGGVTVHGSLQCPYYVHEAMARGLDLPTDKVRVVQAETGGGFGGKEEYPSMLALHASVLALKAGRPVRMVYDRHEDIAATTKRHPSIVRHRTGVTRDGRIVAQDVEVLLDGGAYCTLTPVVLSRATLHAGGPYAVPNVHIVGRAVATNTPPNGAFRGFGAPQVHFAVETHVNRIAEALGISPLEVRRRNAYREGDVTPTGQVLRESVAAAEVLERAAERAEFERHREWTAIARERWVHQAERTDGASSDGALPDPALPAPGAGLTTPDHRLTHGIGLALA